MLAGSKTTPRFVRRVRGLGKYRDSVLVGAALIYLFGYAVWFIVARRQGLGPVPPVDTQYFVAGVTALFMLGLLLFVLLIIVRFFFGFWSAWLEKLDNSRIEALSRKFRRISSVITLVLGLIAVVLAVASIRFGGSHILMGGRWGDIIKWLFSLFVLSYGALSMECSRVAAMKQTDSLTSLQLHVAVVAKYAYGLYAGGAGIAIVVLGAVCWLYYIDAIYTRIPQEFGGAKPRIAQLDLARDGISATMIRLLADDSGIGPNDKAISSRHVSVLFSGRDSIIVNPYPDDPNSIDRVEIPRTVVRSIVWHRDKKPIRKPVVPAVRTKTQ